MGGGTSKVARPNVQGLPGPQQSVDHTGAVCTVFHTVPQDPEQLQLKHKGATVLLEVGQEGFRLLRPDTHDALQFYPWGQVHSWAHGTEQFCFRYFDDSKRSIMMCTLALRDVEALLDAIQHMVEKILTQRKDHAMTKEQFQVLVSELRAMQSGPGTANTPLQVLEQHLGPDTFLTSAQARQVMSLLPSTFDQIEAAVALHSKLVDQSNFASVLDEMKHPADRENVWHRITAAKKAGAGLQARKSGAFLDSSLKSVHSTASSVTGTAPGSPKAGGSPSSKLSALSIKTGQSRSDGPAQASMECKPPSPHAPSGTSGTAGTTGVTETAGAACLQGSAVGSPKCLLGQSVGGKPTSPSQCSPGGSGRLACTESSKLPPINAGMAGKGEHAGS